ncbi:MAG: IMP cyclohydrolase [Bacteroidaceae bacterium]|nr:IMP cyclohydrolase [Bacteroidaceae bacterium]
MTDKKEIKTALISVFHKDGLEELLAELNRQGVKFLSTGGTQTFIESLGYNCEKVEDLTTYPSILGGRVKTLHPKVFGGILGRRELESDQLEMAKYEIPEIDLVVVDLYPFEETVANTTDEPTIIEKIDIGGISLIRAAAKNFNDVVIVPSKAEYPMLTDLLKTQGAVTTKAQRKVFAERAFGVSSHYDTAIHEYFLK